MPSRLRPVYSSQHDIVCEMTSVSPRSSPLGTYNEEKRMFSRAKHDNETLSFCYKFCFQGITQLVNHRKSRGQSLLIPLTKITMKNNINRK